MPEPNLTSRRESAVRAESPLLLDTHIWLWLACGVEGKISPATLRVIERAGNAALVTADQRILDYTKLGHVKTLAP